MAEKNEKTGEGMPEELSIEQTFEALDEIIKKLESGETTLEESFQYYETGMKLVKSCNDQIEKVETRIMVLTEGEQ